MNGINQEDIVSTDFNDFRKFAKKAKKEQCHQKYIFYFDGVYLCVEAEVLINWLKKQLGLENIPTKQRVSSQLNYHGVLKFVGGELTSYISKDKKHKYYQLILNRLKEFQAEKDNVTVDEISYLWDSTTNSTDYGSWGDCSDEDYGDDDIYDSCDNNNY